MPDFGQECSNGPEESPGYSQKGAPADKLIFVFNQFGDCEGAKLRPGNVHSAHDWREVLEPIVARYERAEVRRYFRFDAAFAKPDIRIIRRAWLPVRPPAPQR